MIRSKTKMRYFLILLLLPSIAAQCSVCGDGKNVSKPDEIFAYPGQPVVSCGALEKAGEAGIVPLNECGFLSGVIKDTCGCIPETQAIPPTRGPTKFSENTSDSVPESFVELVNEGVGEVLAELIGERVECGDTAFNLGNCFFNNREECSNCDMNHPIIGSESFEFAFIKEEMGKVCPEVEEFYKSCGCNICDIEKSADFKCHCGDSTGGDKETFVPTISPIQSISDDEGIIGSNEDDDPFAEEESDDNGSIAGCSVCGDGKKVSLPDGAFSYPGQPTVLCSQLETAGYTGSVPQEYCAFLPSLITDVCGCVDTSTPTSASNNTTAAPIIAATAVAPVTTLAASVKQYIIDTGLSTSESFERDDSPQSKAALFMADDIYPVPTSTSYYNDTVIWNERYVVVVFYYSTGGDTWNNSYNFLDKDVSICEWGINIATTNGFIRNGIGCNRQKQVIDINLARNNLKGNLPAELGFLSQIMHFSISSNSISGTLPARLLYWKYLVLFDARYNYFEGNLPAWLDNWPRLEGLALSRNIFSGTIPSSFRSLTNLTYLYLEDNLLEGTLDNLEENTELKTLYLEDNFFLQEINSTFLVNKEKLLRVDISNNAFYGEVPVHLFSGGDLDILDIHENQISSFPDNISGENNTLGFLAMHFNPLTGPFPTKTISNARMLRHLDLTSTSMTGTMPRELGDLTGLKYLFMAGTTFNPGPIPDEYQKLTSLDDLSLKKSGRTGDIPTWIGELRKLMLLDLDSNSFSGTIPSNLGGLERLAFLFLNRNELEGSVPAELGNLIKLDSLFLDHNDLTDGVQSLCEVLPETKLTSDCGPLSNEVECACCAVCCDDEEESAECEEHTENDFLAILNPQWEDNYSRVDRINFFQSQYYFQFADYNITSTTTTNAPVTDAPIVTTDATVVPQTDLPVGVVTDSPIGLVAPTEAPISTANILVSNAPIVTTNSPVVLPADLPIVPSTNTTSTNAPVISTSSPSTLISPTETKPTSPPNEVRVRLDIQFDDYPSEITWSFQQGETIVDSGDGENVLPDDSLQWLTTELSPGEFSFQINDSGGDGLCCSHGSGKYSIILESVSGDIELASSDGIFEDSETKTLSIESIEDDGINIFLENLCSEKISVAIRYQNNKGEWESMCWYNMDPGQSYFPSNNGEKLFTENGLIYIYAESTSWTWKAGNTGLSNVNRSCRGTDLDMFAWNHIDANGDLNIDFTCDPSLINPSKKIIGGVNGVKVSVDISDYEREDEDDFEVETSDEEGSNGDYFELTEEDADDDPFDDNIDDILR